MDPVAHTLFGATLAEAGLKRKTALATGTLIIGANIPDIDAIAMFWSSDQALLFRRGWTHGILGLFLWPFLLTGIILLFDRLWRQSSRTNDPNAPPLRKGVLLGLAFLAVWSHPVLDLLNTYGVRLLMPFSGEWFYGDILFIIDPWMWLLMGAGVVLVRSGSLKSIAGWLVLGASTTALVTGAAVVPVFAKVLWAVGIAVIILMRWVGAGRGIAEKTAVVSLAIFGVYLLLQVIGSRLSAHHAKEQLALQGIEIHEVMADPLPARLMLRGGMAVSDTHYYRYRIHWLDPGSFELVYDPIPIEKSDSIVRAAWESPNVQGLRNWIRYPYYEVEQLESGWQVVIRDLRYVSPDQDRATGIGMAVVELDEDLNPVK